MAAEERGAPAFPAVADAACVLLVAPQESTHAADGCANHLGVKEETADIILVTIGTTPDERLTVWQTHGVAPRGRIAVISVGEQSRAVATKSSQAPPTQLPITIETVDEITDLARLGAKLNDALARWDDNTPTVLCFDSLNPLADAVGQDGLLMFLQVVTGRLSAVGAHGHFHFDPATADEATASMLRASFDASLQIAGDQWVVEHHP